MHEQTCCGLVGFFSVTVSHTAHCKSQSAFSYVEEKKKRRKILFFSMSFPCHLLFYLSELLFKLFKASEEPRWSWQGTRLPTSASPLPLVLLLLPHLSGPLDREDLCPGSSFLWLENWAVVGYCKLNTAAYLEDMNNYNCWGEWSCTASSMKRASHCSATDVQRDTPHPLLAKANRGNLLISKV